MGKVIICVILAGGAFAAARYGLRYTSASDKPFNDGGLGKWDPDAAASESEKIATEQAEAAKRKPDLTRADARYDSQTVDGVRARITKVWLAWDKDWGPVADRTAVRLLINVQYEQLDLGRAVTVIWEPDMFPLAKAWDSTRRPYNEYKGGGYSRNKQVLYVGRAQTCTFQFDSPNKARDLDVDFKLPITKSKFRFHVPAEMIQ